MHRFLFRSRWIAAIWVLATLASIGAYFGEGGASGSLTATTERIKAQQAQMSAPAPTPTAFMEADEEVPGAASEEEEGGKRKRGKGDSVDLVDDQADSYVILDGSEPIEEADDENLRPSNES